jgi:ubiquinone/menaquinone biosynthesis C-methylase UbiE
MPDKKKDETLIYYRKTYDDRGRFLSYFYQCRSVLERNPGTVLEIGIGNKTVSAYLKARGLKVTTCDIDGNLEPDYVADIRNLACFKDESFDVVMACEILEHMPWEDIDAALKELARISKGSVVISLPSSGWRFNINVVFPGVERVLRKDYVNAGFSIPRIFSTAPRCKEHCWEIGVKGFSNNKILKKLGEYFYLERQFSSEWNRYHRFFLLRKRRETGAAFSS